MVNTTSDDPFDVAWRAHRPYLVDLAFRMLGDLGRAEDVVQEAFSRLMRASIEEIDDPRGWLIVVVSRLCLDEIKSARARRERAVAVSDIDGRNSSSLGDPADRITLDDNIRLALIVVLEALNPAERVVFVLHDIFQMPFDAIADTVGRPTASCRQLARRARHKIESANATDPPPDARAVEHHQVTEAFIAACANGDLDGLVRLLAPDVSGSIDTRENVRVVGAHRVGNNLLRFWGQPQHTLVSHSVGDQPVLLGFDGRELAGIFLLSVDESGRISKIHVLAGLDKLDFVRSQLALVSTAV